MSQQTITLVFQDPSSMPIANGTVSFRLNVDGATAVLNGVQVSAGRLVSVTLDSSGSVSFLIWPNDQLFPAGTIYFVDVYTSTGELVLSNQITVTGSGTVTWVLQ